MGGDRRTADHAAEHEVDLRDEAEAARRALSDLRDDQRRVLLLAIDDGLTYDQIARRTGIPPRDGQDPCPPRLAPPPGLARQLARINHAIPPIRGGFPMNHDDSPINRRLELLLDQTLQGLDPAEAAELAQSPPDSDPSTDLSLELAAAAVLLSQVGTTGHPAIPPDLARRIEQRSGPPSPAGACRSPG